MKKLLSFLLALVMLLSLAPAALASGEIDEPAETVEEPVIEETEEEPAEAEEATNEPAEEPAEESAEEPAEEPALDGANSGKCGDHLTWRLKDGVLTISGTGAMTNYAVELYGEEGLQLAVCRWEDYKSSITSVVIESGVTSICTAAFYMLPKIESVTIPDTVTSIGPFAFWLCAKLQTVTIGSGMESIEGHAFEYCRALTEVTIPAGVTSIGEAVFSGCTSLKSIDVAAANPAYCSKNGVLFTKDMTVLINYPCSKTDASYTIPSGVKTIPYGAFLECASLKSVTIPNTVTEIGSQAFAACSSLESVTIPDSVKGELGGSAFRICTSLKSVTIGNGVTEIGMSTFKECTALESIVIGSGVTRIVGYAFEDCTALKSVTIPDGVQRIDGSAFCGCTSLTHVTIPGSVSEFGYFVFSGSTKLKTAGPIGGGYNVEFEWKNNIPEGAFNNMRLTSVTIPAGIKSIGEYAFARCVDLKDVYYYGTESEWNKISIEKGNDSLTSATIHYITPITAVTVTGLDEPQVGGTGDKSVTVPSGAHYRVDSVFWYDATEDPNSALTGNWTFQSGHRYVCSVMLLAEEDYVFTDDLTAAVNGQPADVMIFGSDGAMATVMYEKTLPLPDYYVVSFSTEYGEAPETQYVKKSSGLFGAKAKKPEQDPVDPSGQHTFAYWGKKQAVTDKFGEVIGYKLVEYLFSNTLSSDLTLYAVWEEAPAAVLLGDVNGDGKVNPADRAALARYLAKWPDYRDINLANADVNGDGNVNPADRAYLARYFAKWPAYAVLGQPAA